MPRHENDNDSKRRGSRGSTNNTSRLGAFAKSRRTGGGADWGTADPRWVAGCVVAATLKGVAITFMLSRDGGAHGLTLYSNGERETLWFNGDASLDDELEKVFAVLETL